MTRRGSTRDITARKHEFEQAEIDGKAKLRTWFRSGVGRQAETSRRTGIFPAILSKMANVPGYGIGFEYAVLIEVATEGAVPAHVLCPSRADALGKLLALRSGAKK